MRRAPWLLLLSALVACGGALDPIVGVGDGGAPDAADAAVLDLPTRPGWNLAFSPTTSHLRDIWGSHAGEAFTVGHDGTILMLSGDRWTPVTSGTTAHLEAVWGLRSGEVYAAGAGGTVLQRLGSASDWSPLPAPSGEDISDLWASSPTNIFVVSPDSGAVRRFDGTAWTAQPTAAPGLRAIWGSSPTRIFAAGALSASSQLFFYRYDGTNWNAMTVNGTFTPGVQAIWGDASGAVVAIGTDHFFFVEDDNSWRSDREAGLREVFGVWGLSSSQLFVVGANGGLHFWNGKNLQTWPTLTPSTLRGVWGTDLSNVWVVGDDGVILRY